jgi:hypothetical protein
MIDSRGLQKQSKIEESNEASEAERIDLLADLLLELALEEESNAASS